MCACAWPLTSTSSTRASMRTVDAASHGTRNISGTLAASSKLVNFSHSENSPSCQPLRARVSMCARMHAIGRVGQEGHRMERRAH